MYLKNLVNNEMIFFLDKNITRIKFFVKNIFFNLFKITHKLVNQNL